MSLSVSSTSPMWLFESNATPATSYVSDGLTIGVAQPIYCTPTKKFYQCIDNSDQNNLVWEQWSAS